MKAYINVLGYPFPIGDYMNTCALEALVIFLLSLNMTFLLVIRMGSKKQYLWIWTLILEKPFPGGHVSI